MSCAPDGEAPGGVGAVDALSRTGAGSRPVVPRVVGAAEVGRIDGQVRHVPEIIRIARRQALLDRVLMGSAEGCENQISAVWMPLWNSKLIRILDRSTDLIDLGEIDLRIDSMRKQIQT